jgi:uncharacterized protein YvpB
MTKTKTQTTQEQAEAEAALAELVAAKDIFASALKKFSKVYNPNTVEVTGLIDDIEEMLFEIQADIDETFEEDDE